MQTYAISFFRPLICGINFFEVHHIMEERVSHMQRLQMIRG